MCAFDSYVLLAAPALSVPQLTAYSCQNETLGRSDQGITADYLASILIVNQILHSGDARTEGEHVHPDVGPKVRRSLNREIAQTPCRYVQAAVGGFCAQTPSILRPSVQRTSQSAISAPPGQA